MGELPAILGMTPFAKKRFLVIPAIYLVIAAIYIVLSTLYFSGDLLDVFGGDFSGLPDLARIELVKGLWFVLATALLFGLILYMELRRRRAAQLPFWRLMESMRDAVLIVRGSDRVIVYANRAALNMFGYEAAELIGLSTEVLHVDEAHFHSFFQMAGRKHLAPETPFHTEFECRRKNGEVFPTEHSVSEFQEGGTRYTAGVIRDISIRKEVYERLRESEERFRQITENITEVFWMSDPEKNQMLYVSPAYEEIWGRSLDSILTDSRSFMDAIHPDDRDRVVEAIGRQPDGPYLEDYRIIRPDGKIRWIRDRGNPVMNEHGDVYRIVGVADDITEAVDRESRLRQSQKLESIGQLTGGIAHDFNNLLQVVLGNVEMVREATQGNQRATDLVNRIELAGLRAVELVDRLLTLSRQKEFAKGPVDVDACLSQMEPFLRPSLGEDVIIDIRGLDEPVFVDTDEAYFEASILNLAVNARDAMPKGGRLTIETSIAEIDPSQPGAGLELEPGRYVVVAVSDTGEGMAEEVRQRVFEPFFTTKEAGKGTGLGLAMVYGFVKDSGGHVGIYSEAGVGTTVRLYLPVGELPVADAIAATEAEVPHGDEAILIVEDDLLVRDYVTNQLAALGYSVRHADSGDGALSMLAEDSDVHLLFTDVVLPGELAGPQIAERARSLQPNIKVLFTTGYGERAATNRPELDGADVLSKPYRLRDLAQAVRRSLDAA